MCGGAGAGAHAQRVHSTHSRLEAAAHLGFPNTHQRRPCGRPARPQVTPEMRVDDQEFEENEVYAIDIVVRTLRQAG